MRSAGSARYEPPHAEGRIEMCDESTTGVEWSQAVSHLTPKGVQK